MFDSMVKLNGDTMAKVWTLQSNFSSGEIDPRLNSRSDLQVYYAAAKQARNVTPLVQGGLKRRDGTEFIGEHASPTIDRIFNFEFSTTDTYLLAFAESRMYIYKNGDDLQTNINGSGNDYLTIPYTSAQLEDIDIVQSLDTVIIAHPDVAPQSIVRTSDTDWTISAITLTNIPQFDYNDASSPTPTSEVQRITFANANTSDRYRLGLESILTDDIVFSSDNDTNAENIRIALQRLPNTATVGIGVVAASATEFDVTFAGASAKDWELLTGTAVLTQSASFSVTASETVSGVARTEDVWSAGRGWPRTVTFHQGRLWFGGSKSRPQTLWGSFVNDFFNFDTGRGEADEAIDITLDTDQLNAIQGILSNRVLQIFTTGQEFFISNSPITPENVAASPQSNFGSKRIRPITIDGSTLYIQRTGKAIRQYAQAPDVTNIYESISITLLASHIVVNPIRMAASKGSDEVDANYAYFVNEDGTLLVYNVLGSEGVVGFTLYTATGYTFTDVAVVNDEVFVVLAEGTNTYICRFESDRVTDLGVKKSTPVDGVFTGLDHIEGMTVDIIGDGAYEGQATVSGGQVTVMTGKTTTEVGIPFIPVIETMPLNVPLQNGPNFAEPKKVNRVSVDFYESLGVIVKNRLGQRARIASKTMGLDVFSNPTPFSARKDVWLLGWDNEASVIITQDEPMPMTIIGIGVEVGTQ